MQKFLLVLMCKISLFFVTLPLKTADQSTLQVSQVRDVVQNIEIATQIGQGGQDQINSLQGLEKVFGLTMSVLSFDMNNLQTQELQSISFGDISGGYVFISNHYNRSASVSSNILKELLPLETQGSTNSICLGLFGVDSSGKLLTSLSTDTTAGALDHFNLYIFKSDGTLLGTGPQYIPLNQYYSQAQQKFITPVFSNNSISNTANSSNTTQSLGCLINGKDVTSSTQISYPYLICLENISGVDAPNRHLNFAEISTLLPSIATSYPISSFYQTVDSLEIIVGSKAFSFNQNSLNQSTDIAGNGICADISQYIAPLANTGMKFIFAAVDTNGDLLSALTQTQTAVDHYLLYIFDQNNNLIKAVYINPEYTTDASYFKINQSSNGVTVRLNGQTITQGQQYLYPLVINLTYGSAVKIPTLSSITNKITLKKSETLSSLIYNLQASSGTFPLDLSKKKYFGVNWLDSINGLLAVGQTLLLHVEQALYSSTDSQSSSGYELNFTVYALDSTTSKVSQVAQQGIDLGDVQLSGLSIGYQTNLMKTAQSLSVSAQKLQSNWMAIIPYDTGTQGQVLNKPSLEKISTYGALSAILSVNSVSLIPQMVTSYVTTANTIPGWYNQATKQYSGQGFSLQLQQTQTLANGGYFFVEDTINRNSNKFSGTSGVAALDSKSLLLPELEATIVFGGSCTMVVLAFDGQGNYIPDISTTIPTQFGLFIFNGSGNSLSNSPVFFNAQDYVGLGKYPFSIGSAGSVNFIVNGLGIHQSKSLTYPFALNVTWKLKDKPTPTPTPKPKPKPTPAPSKPVVPSAANAIVMVAAGQTLSAMNYQVTVDSVPVSAPAFDGTFMNLVNSALVNPNDAVWVNLIYNQDSITGTAYTSSGQVIGKPSSVSIDSGVPLTGKIYYILSTGFMGSVQLIETATSKQLNNTWIKIIKSGPGSPVPYSELLTYSLAQLQSKITLSAGSINSTLVTYKVLPGWTNTSSGFSFKLNQMNGGNGYAFVQDPWNGYSTQRFDAQSKTGIAVPVGVDKILTTVIPSSFLGKKVLVRGSCQMVLLGLDQNAMSLSNILDTTNPPVAFVLFVYDAKGNLITHSSFSANNYEGLGAYTLQSTTPPATFSMTGLSQSTPVTLTYPFLLQVNWQGEPALKQ